MIQIRRLDSSALFLLVSNIITLVCALVFQWSVLTLLWIYWVQSVIIGVFTVIKLLMFGAEQHSTFVALGSIGSALFFCVHYGMFHVGYAVFLISFSGSTFNSFFSFRPPDFLAVALLSFMFICNHTFSFIKHYVWEKKQIGISVNQIFTEPYKRIVPMHLTIIAAGFLSVMFPFAEELIIVVFLGLKTIVDLRTHESMHQKDKPGILLIQ